MTTAADAQSLLFGFRRVTSTRQSVVDPWSDPARLEAPLSTAASDVAPSLSFDGRTLIFGSSRDSANNANNLISLPAQLAGSRCPSYVRFRLEVADTATSAQ